MASGLIEVEVGDAEMRSALGIARTPAELIELLQAQQIQSVKLRRIPGSGYETVGQLIFGLSRIGINVEI
ncbi:hypothetical protein [Massilia sp. Root351]|jgi:hypothetical protein|uniref:hypothetical protein n=1 Tax=Massilia sp. Root351 TaxID=1736522 RepID=UPI0012F6ACB6|nr:hypothetical protein [Massilia sp. Root351]